MDTRNTILKLAHIRLSATKALKFDRTSGSKQHNINFDVFFDNTAVKTCFLSPRTLLKKGVLNQHTFYVQKTTHLKVCYSSTPLGVLFACPENNTPLGVF